MNIHQFHPLRLAGATLAMSLVLSRGASAQITESNVDVGGLAIQYADSVKAVGASISPQLSLDWGNRIFEAAGTYSQFGREWSLQGQGNGSLFVHVSRFVAELAAFAGGSTHRDGSHTGELLVNGRVHATHRHIEWFVGVGAGRTSFGSEASDIVLGEAGMSRSAGQGSVTLTVTPVAMGDSVRYADAQGVFSLQRGRIDFMGLVGGRVGDQLTALGGTARVWGNASVTSWVTPYAGVVLSGGTYPIDPTQGFPGGRFVSVALRFVHAGVNHAQSIDRGAPADARAESFAADNDQGVVTFKVLAPSAHSVELTGDFTDWDAQQMTSSGNGWWTLSRPLVPGKYQINLRVDGGKWIAPPGLLSIADEFGGSVGLLVIE